MRKKDIPRHELTYSTAIVGLSQNDRTADALDLVNEAHDNGTLFVFSEFVIFPPFNIARYRNSSEHFHLQLPYQSSWPSPHGRRDLESDGRYEDL